MGKFWAKFDRAIIAYFLGFILPLLVLSDLAHTASQFLDLFIDKGLAELICGLLAGMLWFSSSAPDVWGHGIMKMYDSYLKEKEGIRNESDQCGVS